MHEDPSFQQYRWTTAGGRGQNSTEHAHIDHERSFINLFIHGLDESGNPIVNHDKPEMSLEERIYRRIHEVGAKVRFNSQETSVERGHNTFCYLCSTEVASQPGKLYLLAILAAIRSITPMVE